MREARARFAELLDDAEHGNVTLITRHGHAAAAIVPVALLGRLEAPGAGPLDQDTGQALEAAVASLRNALRALDTLAGQASAAAAPGDDRFARYGLDQEDVSRLREQFAAWPRTPGGSTTARSE
jgi:prevent-host-death family protein